MFTGAPYSDLTQDLVSLREAARLTGLAESTIAFYVSTRAIPSVKIAHARLFSRRAIQGWLAQRQQPEHGQPAADDAAIAM